MKRVVVGLTAIVLLAGCAQLPPSSTASSSPPSAEPSTAPTVVATPEPDLVVTTIVIGPEGMSAQSASGSEITAVSYDDSGKAMIEFLGGILGEPDGVIPANSEGMCIVEPGITFWGQAPEAAIAVHVPPKTDPPLDVASVYVRASAVNGVAIEAIGGLSYGDDPSATFAALSGTSVVDARAGQPGSSGDTLSFVLASSGDVVERGVKRALGVAVLADGGVVEKIEAPRTSRTFGC
jgi:hypothetical protein